MNEPRAKCLTCKFADWQKTKSGALHPNKMGKCVYEVHLLLPASFGSYAREQLTRQIRTSYRGIERDNLPPRCAVYQSV